MSRITKFLAVVLLICFIPFEALAAVQAYTTSKLNVRKSNNTDSEILLVLSKNEAVTVQGAKNGWAKITTQSGVEGYVSVDYLTTTAPKNVKTTATPAPTKSSGRVMYATIRLRVRESSSTSSALVSTLEEGEVVTVLETRGSWSKVRTQDNEVGYAYSEYLSEVQATPTPTPAPASTPSAAGGTKYTTTRINVRKSNSTSSDVVAVLSADEPVTVLATQDSWSKIETSSGKTGFVYSQYLTSAVPAGVSPAASSDVYYTTLRLRVRESNSTSSDIVTTLDEDTPVRVLETKGSWSKIETETGVVGFAYSEYLTKTAPNSVNPSITQDPGNVKTVNETAYISEDTSLYETYSAFSGKLASLSRGDSVKVLAENDSWYRVETASGKKGFVLKSSVSFTKPSATYVTVTAAPARTVTPAKTLTPSATQKVTPTPTPALKSNSVTPTTYTQLKSGSTGTAVKNLQTRLYELGYLTASQVTGKYLSATTTAIRLFQLYSGLSMNGVANEATQKALFSSTAKKYKPLEELDWTKISYDTILPRGRQAYLYDASTGTRVTVVRKGGYNHYDLEPATASDTAALLKLYGGQVSWNSRGMILVAGGHYIVCAINFYPHGEMNITNNNFDGHFCCHLIGSKTHGTGVTNASHQKAIQSVIAAYNR